MGSSKQSYQKEMCMFITIVSVGFLLFCTLCMCLSFDVYVRFTHYVARPLREDRTKYVSVPSDIVRTLVLVSASKFALHDQVGLLL